MIQICLRLRLLLLVPLILLALYGCSSTEELERATPDWNNTAQLEVPPDLTPLQENASGQVFSAAARDASSAELGQYSQFEKFQKMAEFQDFLKWRQDHSTELDLSLEAFYEARNEAIAKALKEKGVLTITTRNGQQILLIDDTSQNSWERLDTATVNMGLHIISSRADQGYLRVHYDTKTPDSEGGWKDWIPWLSDPIIYRITLEQSKNGPTVSIKDDKGNAVNTDSANALIERLGVQLRTFAGEPEQVVTVETKDTSGLALQETATGYLTLVVPGAAAGVWKRLDRQLQDTGFSLASRDKSALRFVIRYDDPAIMRDKSWVQSLAFWKEDVSAPAQDIQLVLTPAGELTRVDALDSNDKQSELGSRIL
ncbi:MAG: outer membrane protein assembly factor BamC, partial [Acidiferrobacteraceae bacterium]|nr:outer membrane protein assembly factor BamC [Acidiferrobacteraceae bacterium]